MIHRFLFNLTANRPCRLISPGGRRYLERYYIGSARGLTFYLHRFVDGDGDRHMHDHPFKWSLALVLTGMYIERIMRHLDPLRGIRYRERFRHAGRLNFIRAGKFHQISRAKPNTWTLFVHSERVKLWGFLHYARDENMIIYVSSGSTTDPEWWKRAPLGKNSARAPVDYVPAGL